MTFKERKKMMTLSLLCFGATSKWKSIMKRGRKTETGRAPISVQEIKDTMDYILNERQKIQENTDVSNEE